ncbi:MAG: hypothetical protein ACYC6N_29505 [Pirellulaceae bacterium]
MMWIVRPLNADHELRWWLVLLSAALLSMGVFAREARGLARGLNLSGMLGPPVTWNDAWHG